MDAARPAPDLMAVLAQALTFRGIRKASWLDIVGAEKDLRSAFEFNPASVHTRDQFAVSLTLLADKIEDRDRYTAADLLREAEQILREGLENHHGHSDMQEHLEDVLARQEPAKTKQEEPKDLLSTLELAFGKSRGQVKKRIQNLEDAWRQDPGDLQRRAELIDALIEHSEELVSKGQYAEAAGELEKWLPEFPDDDNLHKQMDFVREGYKAEAYLRETRLKFRMDLEFPHTFNLSFHSEVASDVVVRLQVKGDVAVISSQLPSVFPAEQNQAFLNLLWATCKVPLHKFCLDASEELSLVAEIPVSLLAADLLERIMRTTANYVDLDIRMLLSFGKLKEHFEMEIVARRIVQPLEWLEEALSADPLPSLCQAQNIVCQSLGDERFSIQYGRLKREIMAYYTDTTVHFTVAAGPLKKKHPELYSRMAEVNAAMQVCKVALDSHQNVVFMVELPGLNKEALMQALESLEKYTASFGAELVK